jgi:energy-converting hydrogenase Eha subunit C
MWMLEGERSYWASVRFRYLVVWSLRMEILCRTSISRNIQFLFHLFVFSGFQHCTFVFFCLGVILVLCPVENRIGVWLVSTGPLCIIYCTKYTIAAAFSLLPPCCLLNLIFNKAVSKTKLPSSTTILKHYPTLLYHNSQALPWEHAAMQTIKCTHQCN